MPNYKKDNYIDNAFNVYFALGAERTLPRLREKLREDFGKAPALRTIENWSAQYEWSKKIKELNNGISKENFGELFKKIAVENFIAKSEMRALAGYTLRKAYAELAQSSMSNQQAMSGFSIMVTQAIALVKAASVEEGGVSDRVAENKSMQIEDKRADAQALVDFITTAKQASDEKIKSRVH